MAVSYNKLWKLLIDKKMNRTQLQFAAGISNNVLARMGKDAYVSMETMERICVALNAGIGDIMEFIIDDK